MYGAHSSAHQHTRDTMDVLASRPVISTSLVLVSAALVLRPLLFRAPLSQPKSIPSPRETLLPHLSPSEISCLPYPPDALPGGRDVPTPYGTVKAFEFGPLHGPRVLLLAGISTPCISLSSLAGTLAARGHRVLLFDYFGRGWSDAPDPRDVDHDDRLYVSQILCVLASSEVSWLGAADREGNGGFHVVGYSFGGGLAVSFASWFGRSVRSVTLVAPGGLMRTSANSWSTTVLYSRGLFPEALLRYFVRRRYEPAQARPQGKAAAKDVLVEHAELGKGKGQEDVLFDDAVISTCRPDVTVTSVMAWQLQHHMGFVPAVMSSFRYGPIHERNEEWKRVGAMLAERRDNARLPGLLGGKVLLILGRSDPIVREEQIVPDMKKALGEEAVNVVVMDGGHEVAITKGREIADAAAGFWDENRHAGEV